MMHEINIKIVAEGVEDSLTYEILKDLGCDFIQGFYFSEALNSHEFLEFVRRHNNKNN